MRLAPIYLAVALATATATISSANTPARGPRSPTCADLGITRSFTSNWGPVSLEQHGCTVSGRYSYRDGRIDGTLEGNLLRYAWTESDGAGRGVFAVATNGELIGTWGVGSDDASGGWHLVPTHAVAGD